MKVGELMHIIGLTGGIATGKSLISQYFKQLNIPICDADVLAKKVLDKGMPALKQLVAHFGEDLLQDNGCLDRHKLATIIFENAQQRECVNAIVHPHILSEIEAWKMTQQADIIVIDMALLIEIGYMSQVDSVMLVTVALDKQIERLMKRNGYTVEQANARIQSQLPFEEKAKYADVIIDNNGTKEYTFQQVDAYLERVRLMNASIEEIR